METKRTVSILGTPYTVEERTLEEDKRLEDCDGYTDWTSKSIVVRREFDDDLANLDDMAEYIRTVKRHEIVHAFFLESGLNTCSGKFSSWATNEEMVDWIARQGPKIYEAWKSARAL